jgi:hypothetical protein
MVEVIEHCGGDIRTDQSLVNEMLGGRDRAIASDEIIANAKRLAKDSTLPAHSSLEQTKRNMADCLRTWRICLHREVINSQRI